MLRAVVDFARCTDLQDATLVHHRDAVGHGERLVLIVGDEHESDAGFLLHPLQFELHVPAQHEVERRQRLVQQQQFRARGQGPCQRHTLLLTTGDFRDLAVRHRLHLYERQHFSDGCRDLVSRFAEHFQTKGNVLPHRHVRKQGVALEHGVHRSAERRQACNILTIEFNRARRRLLETSQQPQQSRLSATGRPEQGEELTVGYVHRYIVEGFETGGRRAEYLVDRPDAYGSSLIGNRVARQQIHSRDSLKPTSWHSVSPSCHSVQVIIHCDYQWEGHTGINPQEEPPPACISPHHACVLPIQKMSSAPHRGDCRRPGVCCT